MTRNWEIIREILLSLESSNTPNAIVYANSFADLAEQEVAYNIFNNGKSCFCKWLFLQTR